MVWKLFRRYSLLAALIFCLQLYFKFLNRLHDVVLGHVSLSEVVFEMTRQRSLVWSGRRPGVVSLILMGWIYSNLISSAVAWHLLIFQFSKFFDFEMTNQNIPNVSVCVCVAACDDCCWTVLFLFSSSFPGNIRKQDQRSHRVLSLFCGEDFLM